MNNGKSKDKREPIAIIGIGCRFPGEANDPQSFWRLLCDRVDAVGEIPRDRWNIDAYYDPTPGMPGKTYSRWGGFIQNIDAFEPECFGISPREAGHMDPQQRVLLEVSREAIEDAALDSEHLSNGKTGVFVGISTYDYAQMHYGPAEWRGVDPHSATGRASSIAANRISYCLNLQGPSIAVDTACSSSLVAIDLACRSLWGDECNVALAGGVNAIISPGPYIAFCAATMLSRDGRCKTFDASADGFVRGEGAGIVVLKLLRRALEDGDPIYALIGGTAVNHDGRTSGIALPSQTAQESLVLDACRNAGVSPHEVDYVEAHGTGTEVGDPIEARALGTVLCSSAQRSVPLLVGSAKTNVGHLEAGAGIVGVIKTALALKHRLIPPNLHFNQPNPNIPFERLRLRVPCQAEPWPQDTRQAIAGVNSFGFGGGTGKHPADPVRTGVFCRTLQVDYAFHSAQMDAVREPLLEALSGLEPKRASVEMISTVTGDRIDGHELNGDYWWRNVRHTVRFRQGINHLVDHGYETFLELGPHPVLAPPISECLSQRGRTGRLLASLRRGEDEKQVALGSLGSLYTRGYTVDWKALWPARARRVRLPKTPWNRQSYWQESEASKAARLGPATHPLLGNRLGTADPVWENRIDLRALPFLKDHKLQKQTVLPATAYVEMAIAAASDSSNGLLSSTIDASCSSLPHTHSACEYSSNYSREPNLSTSFETPSRCSVLPYA